MRTPDGAFWELVRAETAVTWLGRWRALWGCFAVVFAGVFVLCPTAESDQAWPLCLVSGLVAWSSAWLGSDLLSLRFRGNDEPHREWTPRAILARAVGRFGPLLIAQTIWAGLYVGRSIDEMIRSPEKMFMPIAETPSDAIPAWFAWVTVIIVSGMAYAATCALISASTRAPRRLLITAMVMFSAAAIDVMLGEGVSAMLQRRSPVTYSEFPIVFACSNLYIGVHMVLLGSHFLGRYDVTRAVGNSVFLAPTSVFLVWTLLMTFFVRLVLAKRLRIRPHTMSAVPTAEPMISELRP